MAARNARDRDLNMLHHRLENRLAKLNDRLDLADSLLSQIDIRLEKARLEQDIEQVAGQIRRLRLEYVFDSGAPANDGSSIQTQKELGENAGRAAAAPPEPGHDTGVNLLA